MLKKMLLLASALIMSAASAMAMSHESGEGHEHMGPPPGLMIPLPPDTEMPAPEEGPQALVETAIDALDGDEDGQLSKDEIKAAYDAMEMMDEPKDSSKEDGEGPPMGPPPFPHLFIPADFEPTLPEDGPGAIIEAAFGALDSNGDGKLSKDEIKDAFDAAMEMMDKPMDGSSEDGEDGEWEQADCNGTTGNLVIRELSIGDAVAISLPAGRDAGCFTLEVDGADIDDLDFEIQIIEETDPPSDPAPTMWHSDDGKEAYNDLVLGEGIYHVKIIDADGEGLTFTVTFIDYPTE
ncbi:MAG TPA: hypothetical protein EYG11_13315 [Candidatus Latescibacteria bacterium]|nr:hypothetical protein [Candidatus Handelsmanbacteria bacterium]HIL09674.1 hypothetical protein [Candidatus Latescibacterota bacterium]